MNTSDIYGVANQDLAISLTNKYCLRTRLLAIKALTSWRDSSHEEAESGIV